MIKSNYGAWNNQAPQHVYGSKPVSPGGKMTEDQLRQWEEDQAKQHYTASAFALRQKRWNEMEKLEPVSVLVEREPFEEIISWFLANERLEVAGFALIREEEGRIPRLVWAKVDAESTGSGGSVTSNTGAIVAASVIANGVGPNVQLHTHPGMGTFYSGTDQADILDSIDRAPGAGHMYFLVLDQLDWMCRRIHWNEDKTELSYHPVTMWVADTRIKLEFRRKPEQAPTAEGYAQRQGYGYSDYGGYYSSWRGAANASKNYNYTPQPGTQLALLRGDDDDVPVKNVTMGNARLYMGEWSKKPSDYDYLFDFWDVPKYDWIDLQHVIEKELGDGMYNTLIEDRELWEYLAEMDDTELEEMYG